MSNFLILLRKKLRRKNVSLEKYNTVTKASEEKDQVIKQQAQTIMLLERKIEALEKDIEYRVREKLIDQEFIVDLLAYTDIPAQKRKKLERKVSEQKAFIIKYYGRKHP